MKRATAMATIVFACSFANAQFKCQGTDGRVSFQQTPCSASEKQKTLDIRPIPAPGATTNDLPKSTSTVEQRMVAKLESERKIKEKQQEIDYIEKQIDVRNGRMTAEIAALSNQKNRANNNLAGATWEQSLSTEMNAVSAKYKAMNDVDLERLKRLRSELAELQAKAPTK